MNKPSVVIISLIGLLIFFIIFHLMKGSTVDVTKSNQAADATARDLVSPIMNTKPSPEETGAQN